MYPHESNQSMFATCQKFFSIGRVNNHIHEVQTQFIQRKTWAKSIKKTLNEGERRRMIRNKELLGYDRLRRTITWPMGYYLSLAHILFYLSLKAIWIHNYIRNSGLGGENLDWALRTSNPPFSIRAHAWANWQFSHHSHNLCGPWYMSICYKQTKKEIKYWKSKHRHLRTSLDRMGIMH